MFAAACLLGCAAGCTTLVEGSAIPDPIAALSAQSPVIVPSRPTPTFTPTVSPDKVTGACPLISGEEIRGRLKQGADFTYDRMEVPQSEYDGVPVYECKYLGETTHATAFDLAVSIVAGQSRAIRPHHSWNLSGGHPNVPGSPPTSFNAMRRW